MTSENCWWCPECRKAVLPIDVTYFETHDERAGGCGHKVLPNPPALPTSKDVSLPPQVEAALASAWAMVSTCGIGQPGSYARGHENGIGDALRQVRANLEVEYRRTPETSAAPYAWTIPGDDTADVNGFISARINREGEFTKPLYSRPAPETMAPQNDYSELHRVIHAAWYNAGQMLSRDDSPYQWIREIRDEWVEICAGRRIALLETADGFHFGKCEHPGCTSPKFILHHTHRSQVKAPAGHAEWCNKVSGPCDCGADHTTQKTSGEPPPIGEFCGEQDDPHSDLQVETV
jgi:hypothetical protein